MVLKYVTTLDLARELQIKNDIPNWDVGGTPTRELISAGSGTVQIAFLDHKNIINNAYSLYYNATSVMGGGTALTETTDYTIDLNSGKIIITGIGAVKISTKNIYGEYSYCGIDLPDNHFQRILERAEKRVDNVLHTCFANGTAATPLYGQVIDEKQSGRGKFNREYYTKYYPLPNILTNLTSAATTAATSLSVQSTNGFPSSGVLAIATNKIEYTAKSGSAFTGVTGVSATHASGATISPNVIEISTTDSGTRPSWVVLNENVDYDIDLDSGRISIYITDYDLTYYSTQYPPREIPNRFRSSYLYGYNNIPYDIQRLTLLYAKQMLINDAISKSYVSGRNEFRPELLGAEAKEMQDIINSYISYQVSNT